MIGFLRSVLEEHGITCLVKNELLLGASGEIPPNECWPELWVVEDRELSAAERVVARALRAAPGAECWACPRCDEPLEPQFTECWRCAGAAGERP